MKTIKYFLAVLTVVAAVSCSLKEQSLPKPTDVLLTASFADSPNKTTIADSTGSVYWEPGDQLSVFFDGTQSCFTSTCKSNVAVSTFSGSLNVVVGFEAGFSNETPLWGLYPYNSSATSDNESVTTKLPETQTGREGTFAKDANITVGRSQSLSMGFYNVCGGVAFSVTKAGVESVVFEGNDGENLAGTIKVKFEGGVPVIDNISNGVKSITLNAPAGGFEVGKFYYLSTVPATLAKGFKMTFNTATEYAVLDKSNSVTIKRGSFGKIAEADKGLTYQEAPTKYTKLADLAATATSTEKTFSASIKATVTYAIGRYAYLEDASGALMLYVNSHGLSEGDVVTGEISGKLKLYNSGVPQITSLDKSKATITTTTVIPCTTMTLADLKSNFASNVSRKILLKGITIDKGTSSGTTSSRTGQISQNGSTIQIYAVYSSDPAILEKDKTGDLICFPSYKDVTQQLSVMQTEDFQEVTEPAEESEFTKLTTFGVYDLSDSTKPVVIFQAGEYDQLTYCTYDATLLFNMFSLESNYGVFIDAGAAKYSVGTQSTLGITATGVTGLSEASLNVKAVKVQSGKVWLKTTDGKTGYIIGKE